jgi:hypothetical protein
MPKEKQKKQTRRYRRGSKKYVYSKKTHKQGGRASRKYIYSGGMDTDQITDLKNIISKYIATEKSKQSPTSPPSKKYEKNEEDIDKYTTTIAAKDISALRPEDLVVIQRLAINIIDETSGMSIISKSIQKMQKLINGIVLYFINEIEMTDSTDFILKKRITNNMPYLDVIRKRDGYETTYDVNEMLALIKSEMNKDEYPSNVKKSLLKKLTIDSKFGLQTVPPPTPVTPAPSPVAIVP